MANSIDQMVSRYGLDLWQVLTEKCGGILNVWRLHFDATSLSSAVVRDLKMEGVSERLRALRRPEFAAHLVSPIVR